MNTVTYVEFPRKDYLRRHKIKCYLKLNKSGDNKVDLEYCSKTITELSENIMNLHENHGLSITNKMHTIESHVMDYMNITGKTLDETNDQVIEATHQDLYKRLDGSNYQVTNKETLSHGGKLLKGVHHYNSYNL